MVNVELIPLNLVFFPALPQLLIDALIYVSSIPARRLHRAHPGRSVLRIRLLHPVRGHHSAVQMDVAHKLLPGQFPRDPQLGVRHEPGWPVLSGNANLLSLQEPGPVPEGHGHRARRYGEELHPDCVDCDNDVHRNAVRAVVQTEQTVVICFSAWYIVKVNFF